VLALATPLQPLTARSCSLCGTVSSAEDPEKILDQAVEDMQNDLIRLRQAAAEVR
jgi:phage shock protein A